MDPVTAVAEGTLNSIDRHTRRLLRVDSAAVEWEDSVAISIAISDRTLVVDLAGRILDEVVAAGR